jgi:hypothetical protein
MKAMYFVVVGTEEHLVEMTDAQVKKLRTLVRRFEGTVTRVVPTDYSLLVEHLENS